MTLEHPIEEDDLLAQRRFLWRLARALVGDGALADDVVQEVELRALSHRGAPADARAWLVTVTRRIALNLRRATTRRTAHEETARRGATRGEPEPPEVLAGVELQQGVLAAVRALEEPYRAVVWLRFYEGLKPQAIAARLGVPLATVKTRLRRALERLRGALDAAHGGRREAWAAALAPLAAEAGGIAGAAVGGLIVKPLVVAASLVALVFVGWRSWGAGPARSAARQASRAAAELAEPTRAGVEIAVAPGVAAARREVVEEPPERTAARATSASPTVLAVHVTHAIDGSDAAGIGLVLYPEGSRSDSGSLAELDARVAATDEQGRARFEGVEPGTFVLHTDRTMSELVELAAGEERALALALPAGVDVDGRVVDGAGAPVADADIWLEGEYSGVRGGRVVARSDWTGRFALRSLDEHQALGAFAPGFAPSFLAKLQGADGGELAVTLVLDREGSELSGRVVDPAGNPLAGARVAFGTHGRNVGHGRTEDVQGWLPSARLLTTDADGRFEIGWLAFDEMLVTSLPLHVLARGFALARVDVDRTTPAELSVQLEVGATIEGVVRDAEGSPVEGAWVEVERAGLVRSSDSSDLPGTWTGADGAYRLSHVPSGEVRLRVTIEGEPRLAEGARSVADGADARWDIVVGGPAAAAAPR